MNSASHGWRGILAGREVIKKGLGWAVGDGKSISIWQDKWLSTSQQICPIGPPAASSQQARVNELMFPNSVTWDIRKIRNLLPQYEDLILKLIPSSCSMKDEMVWLLEKTGEYTTKTGYAVAKINAPYNQNDFSWRKCIWNVKCSPKLQHFLWKLRNDAIAVGDSLAKRGIQVERKCKRCGAAETTLHVMFSCPFAQNVWNLAPLWRVPCINARSSMGDLLLQCTRLQNLPPTGLELPLYPWLMWVLWTSRNQLLFEDKSFSETEVILKAIKSAKEWQDGQIAKQISVSTKDYTPGEAQPQHSPATHLCYSDAAWNSSSCEGGLGWICLAPNGGTSFTGSAPRQFVASALVAEALALKTAIEEAVTSGIQDMICFSDSKCLISLITGNKSVIALKGILHDIRVLSSSLNSISFKFVSRNCNVEADRLAKDALFELSLNPSVLVNNGSKN